MITDQRTDENCESNPILTSTLLQTVFKALADSAQHAALAMQIHRERRALASISDESLRDIGLDRHSVNREANRCFFDITQNRRTWKRL